jgi:hypothetical protein
MSDAASSNSDHQEDAKEIGAPLVFSCGQCKTIVGDTYSFENSDEETKTITLSAASNIQRTAELYTSYSAHDEGSTYFCFSCKNCGQLLGRYYVTTSKDLDILREKFTFGIESITSYELGTSQHGKLPDAVSNALSNQNNQDKQGKGPEEQGDLQFELLKVQHVMLDLVQRVTCLESQLANVASNSNSNVNINHQQNSASHTFVVGQNDDVQAATKRFLDKRRRLVLDRG